MRERARNSGPDKDPLTWLLDGLLDLLFLGLDRMIGKRVEALIKRLPHR